MLALLAQATFEEDSSSSVINFFIWGLWALAVAGSVYVLVDTLRRPDWVWPASGQQKGLWIALGIGGLVSCCFVITSFAVAGIYAFAIRPKLDAAQRNGPSGFGGPGGFGGPPGGYGGPPGGYGGPPGGYGGAPGGYGGAPGGYPGGGTSGSPGWGPPPPPPPPPPVGGGWNAPS